MMTPRTPVPVRPFPGQIMIPLTPVQAFTEDGPITTWCAPDLAPLWRRIHAECGDKLVISSAVDFWRPWKSSYRAAQLKSNAALPGESPHFFGLSFDVDLRETRRRMGLKSSAEVRGRLRELGAFPHPSRSREDWHIDLADVPGRMLTYRESIVDRLSGAAEWALDGAGDPRSEAPMRCQRALAAIDDQQTGEPYYKGKIDGDWKTKSADAYAALYRDWPAAWIRTRGLHDRAYSVDGRRPPTDRGRWILATLTARFEIVEVA